MLVPIGSELPDTTCNVRVSVFIFSFQTETHLHIPTLLISLVKNTNKK